MRGRQLGLFRVFLPRITVVDCALLRHLLCCAVMPRCAVGKLPFSFDAAAAGGKKKKKKKKKKRESSNLREAMHIDNTPQQRACFGVPTPRNDKVGAGLDGSHRLGQQTEGIVSGSGIDAAESDWVHRSGLSRLRRSPTPSRFAASIAMAAEHLAVRERMVDRGAHDVIHDAMCWQRASVGCVVGARRNIGIRAQLAFVVRLRRKGPLSSLARSLAQGSKPCVKTETGRQSVSSNAQNENRIRMPDCDDGGGATCAVHALGWHAVDRRAWCAEGGASRMPPPGRYRSRPAPRLGRRPNPHPSPSRAQAAARTP